MDYLVVPNYVECKGSLFLRSDHMNYGRSTLNSNWHQAREAEPKDYDIAVYPKPPGRNLHTATYERIGNVTKKDFPQPTTAAALEQIRLKPNFTERETRKPMIDVASYTLVNIDRNVKGPRSGFGAVLPRHHPDHDKLHLETTHRSDFVPPYPYEPAPERPPDFRDNSKAYKRYQSQFTDTADYRRSGRNTFQDESGIYGNTADKRRVYQKTNTIPERLIEGLK